MHTRTLARPRLDGTGWAHPYGHGPFSPIVYADGGDGAGSGSGSAAAGDGTGDGGQAAAPSWDGFQWDGKVDSLPPDVAKVIRDAREEAGKARTTAKENAAQAARQELLATFSKAVGLDTGEKPPTPEELTHQLTQSQTALTAAQEQAASAAIELHVYKTAARLGANADALLDSRTFCDSIDNLDTSDGEFQAAVEKAITDALDANPQLRTAQVARRGGGDFAGGPGTQQRPTSLHAAIAARMGG
ncbi:hypothetical protein ACFQ67_00160 [Streptomyces sp. NPDC056488]|uniref:hypothetical protein n=1 Tax=Streptomyces sp. NPDC056488 TaxID=3345836 RepID=UPI0036B095E3